jgi:hypothetical protein
MKNKPSVSKKPVIAQGGPPRDLPLKTDELIDLLGKSYEQSAASLFDLVDSLVPVLLFLRQVIIQDAVGDNDLILNPPRGKMRYSSVTEAIGEIISGFPERLYEARYQMDEESTRISVAIRNYRESHRKVAAA